MNKNTSSDDPDNSIPAVAINHSSQRQELMRSNDEDIDDCQPPTKKRAVGYKLVHRLPNETTSELPETTTTTTVLPIAKSLLELPDSILCHCASFLSIPDVLLRLSLVNGKLRDLTGERDAAGWKSRVERLQSQYQFIAAHNTDGNWLATYQHDWIDLHERQFIHERELCYDLSGTVFQFRFKTAAGTDWTEHDPWHSEGRAKRIVFLREGNRCQELMDDGSFGVAMTWRWIARPMDLPRRPQNTGHYVRLTISGRDVPTYSVRRSETGNGGFIMESCWGMYCSFAMSNDLPERVTNDIQWREAFLYNVGSRTLPEGEEAIEEFDRAWQG